MDENSKEKIPPQEQIIEAFLILSGELKELKTHLLFFHKTRAERFKESWISGDEVMMALDISKRTLQSLRTSGKLPYSRINGKFYYRVTDLEGLLDENYCCKQ